jgi:hypothetical protein
VAAVGGGTAAAAAAEPAVVTVSRDLRALGRELRPVPTVRRRSLVGRLLGWVFRHLPEIVLLLLVIRVWQACADRIGPLWTDLLGGGLVVVLVWWRRSRRWLLAVLGCMVTRARLRAAFAELRLCRRSGRLPFTVALVPTPVGERVWLLCPVGVSAEDIADESDRLRAACFAREVRTTRDRRFSALVVLDVIRRDPLASSRPVGSPLGGRFDVPRPRQAQER